ncbi:MAG: AEC family transporter, partial [Proteobacteria bacterium]|nr:AEC family transporter [Pseudomonadota bacterium]
MVELFLNVIAPVFVIAGLGWGWNRLNIHYDAKTITLLVMNIGVPSLVFSTISSLSVSKEVLGQVGLAAVAALTTMAVIAFVVLKVTRRPVQSFLPPLMFGNVGNIGLPVCFFAFGEAGLTYATIVFAVYALSMMTIGPWIYSGIKNPAHLARSPI